MNNICMLRHSKIVIFKFNIIEYFFSFLYARAWYAQKEKYAKKIKSKKNQNAFKFGCKRVSKRCRSYMMYLEGDSPHQTVMIMCECIWFSHIKNCHNMRDLCTLAIFSHTTHKFFATFDTCVGTMWFGHDKEYMCWYMLTKLSLLIFEI